jgi:succinoglycan biosynthesis transport protein ExoP
LAQTWRILCRRKVTLCLIALAPAVTAFLLTQGHSPFFRATTLLQIENLNEDFMNMRNVSPTASATAPFQSPDYNLRTQVIVLQSRPVLERTIGKMDLERRLVSTKDPRRSLWSRIRRNKPEREAVPLRKQALAMAAAGLKARSEPNTTVIEVDFDSTDPEVSADFANSLAAAFNELTVERRRQSSQNTSEWLSAQLADVKSKLEKAEDALQKYASEFGLTFLSEKDNATEDRLRQLQGELSRVQAERVAKQSMYELATSADVESLPQVLDDSTLKEYQVQLTTLRRQMADLTSSLTAEHPKVLSVKAQLSAVESALEIKRSNIMARIRNEFAAASQREKMLSAVYSAQLGLVSRQASNVVHYSVLKREVDTMRQLYDSMIQRVKEARLASELQANAVRVIEPAAPPSIPLPQNAVTNTAVGLLVGMFVGSVFIILRARLYRGIQEPGDTVLELNVPELGVIPASDVGSSRVRRLLGRSRFDYGTKIGIARLELTMSQQRPSALAESFRSALTSIVLAEKNGVRPRVIVLSSANPGEGKTTVISNLGIALAQANKRVLLIDGDLRKPRLHEIFEIDNSIGFSDALKNNLPVAVRETRIPNLYLLPSGKRIDDGAYFTSELGPFFRRLKAEFDMILVDTPPLLQISDARLMGHCADAVILVVAQHTAREAVALAQERLTDDGSFLLGTILNNWNPKTSACRYTEYSEY